MVVNTNTLCSDGMWDGFSVFRLSEEQHYHQYGIFVDRSGMYSCQLLVLPIPHVLICVCHSRMIQEGIRPASTDTVFYGWYRVCACTGETGNGMYYNTCQGQEQEIPAHSPD